MEQSACLVLPSLIRRCGVNEPVIYFDITALVRDLKQVSELTTEQITENVLQDIGKEITINAQQRAPVKTGKLRQSIHYFVRGGTLTIDASAEYAPFIEFGTGSRGEFPGKPYVIKPKKGKYLVFKAGGKTIYTKQVTHPGIAAQPYLRPAAIDVMGPLLDKLAERGQALIVKGPNSAL